MTEFRRLSERIAKNIDGGWFCCNRSSGIECRKLSIYTKIIKMKTLKLQRVTLGRKAAEQYDALMAKRDGVRQAPGYRDWETDKEYQIGRAHV